MRCWKELAVSLKQLICYHELMDRHPAANQNHLDLCVRALKQSQQEWTLFKPLLITSSGLLSAGFISNWSEMYMKLLTLFSFFTEMMWEKNGERNTSVQALWHSVAVQLISLYSLPHLHNFSFLLSDNRTELTQIIYWIWCGAGGRNNSLGVSLNKHTSLGKQSKLQTEFKIWTNTCVFI